MRVHRVELSLLASCAGLLAACTRAEPSTPRTVERPPLDPAAVSPSEPRLSRLTVPQYKAIVRDLFGARVAVPSLEPDFSVGGLISTGATETAISPWGVEQYEEAAYSIAEQALADEAERERLVGCMPDGVDDAECASAFLGRLARRAFRRPVLPDELETVVRITTDSARTLGSFWLGLRFGIAAILQSPSFLYRADLGEPDPERPGRLSYSSVEMAGRLAFFFWNTAPDDELLGEAESGALSSEEGVRTAAARLLASPRARDGLRNFFTERFELYRLDQLSKDPTLFTHFSPGLGASAKEETLRVVEHLVFDLDGDFRDLFTTQTAFIDRRLAALYGVAAPARDGFGRVTLAPDAGRRGLFGQVSFLALRAHAVSTSATLRGKFIKEVILCRSVPPPPANANTAIPEVSATARTLRERLTQHLENPVCSSCHLEMDTIGLGFERFDGIGRARETDNGAAIDPSGDVDGVRFEDAWDLGRVVREHPDVPRCFVEGLYRYATGLGSVAEQATQIDDLTLRFSDSGFRVKSLLVDIVASPGFRGAREVVR
ncbi:MAG: DUF1592 domain-containing protein [Deltaproteobacteria bacterium]|nr:DUF1592 domain-containing protein [Deltaproteobacteria bacterium]